MTDISNLGDDELRARLLQKARSVPITDQVIDISEEDIDDFNVQLADFFVECRDVEGVKEHIEQFLEDGDV